MYSKVFLIFFGTIVAVAGTIIGSFIGVLIKNPSKKTLSTLIGFSGGLMLSVVCFDLIPEALLKWNLLKTITICLVSIFMTAYIDYKSSKTFKDDYKKVAFLVALGLMIHNLPEGIIMGASLVSQKSLGIRLAFIICIHDIPEGIAVASPLMASKEKVSKIILYSLVTALPTVLGTFIGEFLGLLSNNVLGISIAFASGIMLYVVCGEMLPESSSLSSSVISKVGIMIGIILGIVIINII